MLNPQNSNTTIVSINLKFFVVVIVAISKSNTTIVSINPILHLH